MPGRTVSYDINPANDSLGFVNLDAEPDAPEFPCAGFKIWLTHVGLPTFPQARRICLACGGIAALEPWKAGLQEIADETGLEIHVSHYPPGTSKWNKTEHRLVFHGRSGRSSEDMETAADLIGPTKAGKQFAVQCVLESAGYPAGRKAARDEGLNIEFVQVGGADTWNYIIRPRPDIR